MNIDAMLRIILINLQQKVKKKFSFYCLMFFSGLIVKVDRRFSQSSDK